MKVTRVKMADVYPVQDEYGNTFTTRDFSEKANQEYVRALADTFAFGEPDTPPMLIEDGGIYRIKDGNCRVEAMKLLGTKEFTAIIDERSSVQDVIATVIRTNTKKQYEEVERSRFVQQLTMFADDEYVAKAAHLKPEQVRKIRKGAKIVGDAADDMSLEHLMAIEEFADDQAVVDKIKNLTPKQLERAVKEERRKRTERERIQKLIDTLKERGVRITDSVPDGYTYYTQIGATEGIPKNLPDGTVGIAPHGDDSYWVILTIPKTDSVEQEREIRDGVIDQVDKLIDSSLKPRLVWIAQAFERRMSISPLLKLCEEYTKPAELRLYEQVTERTLPPTLTDVAMMAYAYSPKHAFSLMSRNGSIYDAEIIKYTSLVDAMKECGYEPDSAETDLYNLLTELQIKEANDGK